MTLEEYIKKRKNPLSIIEIKEFLLELNKILKKMNDNKIIHRNLKLSNILLSLNKERIDKSSFKISDFGLININEGNISSKVNSFTMSFEILKREENLISSKSDIWSLGIIIYYLLFKEYPYNDGKYNIIKQNEENIILKNIDNKELNELVKKMLNPNVEKRISWEEYFNHSFFNNQFNQLDLPLFNINCKNHAQNYYAYCPKCKQNICKVVLKEHLSHKVILFSKIGISDEETKEFDNLINNINNNIQKIIEIKKEINEFINNLKSIKINSCVYKNDNENNFKYYVIQYLNIINKKIQIKETINFPKIKYDNKIIESNLNKEIKNTNNSILKFIMIGDSKANKSKLLIALTDNTFDGDYEPTIEVDFRIKKIEINNKLYKIQIWDTTGIECFTSIARTYYKGADCALIIFNISDKNTFNNIPLWIEDIKGNIVNKTQLVLIGNKIGANGNREVTYDEGKNLAEIYNLLFYEVDKDNIQKVFYDITKSIVN